MGFELEQGHSHLESVNEFKERMEDALMEAKAALAKSKDEIVRDCLVQLGYSHWKT